jgi:hypothetical protein
MPDATIERGPVTPPGALGDDASRRFDHLHVPRDGADVGAP